jgi:hypothetical protein
MNNTTQFDLYYKVLEDLFTNQSKAFENRRNISWGTPPKEVFYKLKEINLPILEIGSGAGFIAKGLQILGCDIYPTDLLDKETYKNFFTNVEKLEMMDALKKYGTSENYAFLSVWPRMHVDTDLFTSNDLPLPKYIVWCGEEPGGCTGIVGEGILGKYKLVGAFRGTLNDKIWMNEITVILERGEPTSWEEIFEMAGSKKYF